MTHPTNSPALDAIPVFYSDRMVVDVSSFSPSACARTYLPCNEAIGPRALPTIVNDAALGAGREMSGTAR